MSPLHLPRGAPIPALLLSLVLGACGPDPLPPTGEQWVEELDSPTLGEPFVLRIRTPPDVDPERAYPLVIQLDPTYLGTRQLEHTVGLVSHHEAVGEWAEAIVVGLDFEDPWRRMQHFALGPDGAPLDPDFGHGEGADRLYAALRDEVLPHLDATLPIDPGRRVLVGHSNGGIFVWYVAFRHAPPEPPLFAGLVAGDAGIDEELFVLEAWHAERSNDLPVRLYATRAAFNGPAQRLAFEALVERLSGRGHPRLALEAVALETDHGGAIVPSYEGGLAFTLGSFE